MAERVLYNVSFGQKDPFDLFDNITNIQHASQLKDSNGVVLLHGGVDICPQIYGENSQAECQVGNYTSMRDRDEIAIIQTAWKMGMPIIGICRGAQLLCAIDGGKLAQHILGHTGADHTIVDTLTGEVYRSNSCHHQMMIPSKESGADILAVDTSPTRGIDNMGKSYDVAQVPEIVHFPQLRAIGIQGHPEWKIGSPFAKYCAQLIKRYIL